MKSMGVQGTLAVLLLFMATVKASDGKVEFWGKSFTMTCPENGTWFNKQGEKQHEGSTYELIYDAKTKGSYYCEYQTPGGEEEVTVKMKYYFYVKGKACERCFELDAKLLALVIVVDVVGTAVVMLVIYKCTKKKSSAGTSHTSKAPARSGGRGPPVPSPDYEQLNLNTRSQDPYSVVNRMG